MDTVKYTGTRSPVFLPDFRKWVATGDTLQVDDAERFTRRGDFEKMEITNSPESSEENPPEAKSTRKYRVASEPAASETETGETHE